MSNICLRDLVQEVFKGYEPEQAIGQLDLVWPALILYPGSLKWHQPWPGGLHDHIVQVAEFMIENRKTYRIEGFADRELVTLALLHDWEKLWKYAPTPTPTSKPEIPGDVGALLDGSARIEQVRNPFVSRAGSGDGSALGVEIPLRIGAWARVYARGRCREEYLNALSMSEGGWSALARRERFADTGPLAALLHAADNHSAKVTPWERGYGWEQHKDKRWEDIVRMDEIAQNARSMAQWPE